MIVDISARIASEVALKSNLGQKGKKPWMQKIIYMNLLVELAQVFRAHGLYPTPASRMGSYAPDLLIAYKCLVEKSSDRNLRIKFGKHLVHLEMNKHARFNTATKKSVLKQRALAAKDKEPSIIEMFLGLYAAYLNETHLSGSKESPVLAIAL